MARDAFGELQKTLPPWTVDARTKIVYLLILYVIWLVEQKKIPLLLASARGYGKTDELIFGRKVTVLRKNSVGVLHNVARLGTVVRVRINWQSKRGTEKTSGALNLYLFT